MGTGPWPMATFFMACVVLALLLRARFQPGAWFPAALGTKARPAGRAPQAPKPAEEDVAAYRKEVEEALREFGDSFIEKLDKNLDTKLRKVGPKAGAPKAEKSNEALGDKIDALIDTKMDAIISSIEAGVDRRLEMQMDQKLEVKVNRKIDFRINKAIGAGKLFAENPGGGDGQTDNEWTALNKSDYVDENDPNLNGTCSGSSVTTAPKDYCGLSSGKPCMDHWEINYMVDNAAKLKSGLDTIRAPGCWPQGASVAAMGYFRTGSTLLYNTARLWAVLGAGESMVAGWLCKDPELLGVGVRGRRQRNCTVVCKDHLVHNKITKHASVLLMSRRDPFYSVCSRKLMDQWCKVSFGANTSAEEYTEARAKCLSDPVLERNESIKQCHDLMSMQARIYDERQAANKTIAYDVLMEDYKQNPAREVRAVARGMGICEAAVRKDELVNFVVGMGTQLHDAPDKDMGITQMHDVHTPDQRKKKCSSLDAWMRSDEGCREWMESGASHTANAELRKLQEKRTNRLAEAAAQGLLQAQGNSLR